MNGYLHLDPGSRISDFEGKTLELKRDLSSPDGPLRTIAAFANSAGGWPVIGVADDGTVVRRRRRPARRRGTPCPPHR